MAVKKVIRKKVATEAKRVTQNIDVSLPDHVTEISNNLEDYTWMLYGERKIGKTTLLSQFNNPLFLMFDPLNKGLAIKQVYINSWEVFIKILHQLKAKLKKSPNYCNMVVIDTGFMCYERCYQYKIKKLGITDPKDRAWGSAWKEISREFMEAHDLIFDLGVGFAVTAHAQIAEITRKDGSTYNKLTTQLGAQAFKFYNGLVDVIAFYQYNNKNQRELTIAGDALVEAGARIDNHFKYTNGEPVKDILMGKTSKDAYSSLLKAFNNKLTKEETKTVAKKKPIKKRK